MKATRLPSIIRSILLVAILNVTGSVVASAQMAPHPPGPQFGVDSPPPPPPGPQFGVGTPPPPSAPPLGGGTPPPPPPAAPPVAPPPPSPVPPGWGAPGFLAAPPQAGVNQGTINVMATGYDSESVLVQIPLVVSYSYNGAMYDVTVVNSWDPYTQTWNFGVDTPAYNTSYYFNGFNYNYYAVLSTGTYYFNL
ncbi:MAG: hypothetical protein J1F38_04870 [Muribaculaceae bacterium]|nr:hypothetical protein [Muribaculaceae bacterium]